MSDNRILFSDKNYRLLMTGQTVSTLGNSVSSFAFFAYTLALTQSPFYAALVSGCVTLAIVVMGIPAGIWADKYRSLPLMLSSTILGGAGICVVVANHFILHAPIPLVLAVAACLVGSATAVFSPAEKAALKTLVSPEYLGQAMAINQTRYSLGTVAGPIFGAFLHSLRPIATFVFDLCTYVFAFCTFKKLQVPDTRADVAENDAQAGYRETLKILRADTVLWAVLWFTPILNFSMSSIFNSAFTQLAGAENGAYVLGVFQTYCGIMGLIGSTAATVLVFPGAGWRGAGGDRGGVHSFVRRVGAGLHHRVVFRVPGVVLAAVAALQLDTERLFSGPHPPTVHRQSIGHDHDCGDGVHARGNLGFGLHQRTLRSINRCGGHRTAVFARHISVRGAWGHSTLVDAHRCGLPMMANTTTGNPLNTI